MHQIRERSAKTVVPENRRPEVDMTERVSEHLPPATRDALANVNMEAPVSGDNEALMHDVREHEDLDDKNSGQPASSKDIPEVYKIDFKGKDNVKEHVTPSPRDSNEAINMEVSATVDEVIRAGGFGATDDISSFLPVASDYTDFEAHLRDVEDYEDLEKGTARPGLGWTNDST